MKNISLFFLCAFLAISCSEDCCYDGEPLTPEEAKDVLGENGSEDKFSLIYGQLKCPDGMPISNRTLIFTDEQGAEYETNTNDEGEYDLAIIPSGNYILSFTNEAFYPYTAAEYSTIVNDLSDIILNVQDGTALEEIAYHMVNLEDGLTTLDKFYFQQLEDGANTLDDVDFPWRYITAADLSNNVITISNFIDLVLGEDEIINLDIVAVYFGDPTGVFCN